jgi:hypothetical protein
MPPAVAPASPLPTAPEATEEAAPEPPSALVAEIERTRWTGSLLARDLALEGSVRGTGIERVALAVVDARGHEVRRVDRLPGIDEQLAAAIDRDGEATFPWRAEIDGKRLLAARFPVTVTVTVYDRGGRSSSATREVDR